MAARFSADTRVAGQTAQDLEHIRQRMHAVRGVFDQYRGATGSSRIESALNTFFSKSSDSREAMNGLLERSAGLLRGLVEAVGAQDRALTDALTAPPQHPHAPTTPPSRAPAPRTAP